MTEQELLDALNPEDMPNRADGERLFAEGRSAELDAWVDSQLRFLLDYLREGMADADADADAETCETYGVRPGVDFPATLHR